MYHDIMSAQQADSMKLDVYATLTLIDYNLHQKTAHFAYPEGQKDHYNAAVIAALKSNGIVCSPSAIDGINTGEEDLFNLKRIMPGFMSKSFPL